MLLAALTTQEASLQAERHVSVEGRASWSLFNPDQSADSKLPETSSLLPAETNSSSPVLWNKRPHQASELLPQSKQDPVSSY